MYQCTQQHNAAPHGAYAPVSAETGCHLAWHPTNFLQTLRNLFSSTAQSPCLPQAVQGVDDATVHK